MAEPEAQPDPASSSSSPIEEDVKPVIPHARTVRPISQPDIIEAIMDVCQQEESYGTMALLGLFSKHHHSLVQHRLRRIRKRVVLHLDEFLWRDKKNDKNIEIIECTQISPLPVTVDQRSKLRSRLDALQQDLQPRMIVYRGQPHKSVLNLWTHVFPSVTTLVCSEDPQMPLVAVEGALPLGTTSRWPAWTERLNNFVETFYADHMGGLVDDDRVINLRYRLHASYGSFRIHRPGRRLYVFKGVTEDGDMVLDQEIYRSSNSFPQSSLVSEISSLLADIELKTAALDCYVHLSDFAPGPFFHAHDDDIPAGYLSLSRAIERYCANSLASSLSRFTLRLFVLGHPSKDVVRADMAPIFSTTCTVQVLQARRTATVLQRFIDDDFAKCPLKQGCNRCRRPRA